MKKILVIITILVLTMVSVGCKKEEKTLTDAVKFKEEYEALNGQKNQNDVAYREITISEDNPFIYTTAEEVVKKIDNGETFAIYFGFKSCPWCRSILPTLIKVADDLNINKIYYVDVLEVRNTYELNDKNKPEETKKGSEGYYELLERLDNVLSDYTLTDSKGKTVKVGEKRIYAPNIVSIVDGKAEKLTEGISEFQTDGYMELTQEMQDESYDKIKCVLDCLAEDVEACHRGC